jgi:hypothetical protein
MKVYPSLTMESNVRLAMMSILSRLRSHARRGCVDPVTVRGARMNRFPVALVHYFGAALCGGLLVFSSSTAFSSDNCRRLEALAHQYAGVQLTSDQKQIKRQMVAWYSTNCVRQARR